MFVFAILTFCNFSGFSQLSSDKMDWWEDAKFGMFIHWGVYAVPAGIYDGKEVKGYGEWIMNRGKIPVAEYKAYARQFNPVKYDPKAWVKLAKEAGMKYLVITSKHHDGFALFDSKVTDWDMVDATPYGKDLLRPLAEACRKEGIKLGFYYSQAQDWSHPGGAAKRHPVRKGWANPDSVRIDEYTLKNNGHWDPTQEGSMDEYLDKIAVPQVKEILENYGELDILWWDTPTNMTKERAEKFLPVISRYPNLITNNRLGGGYEGDTKTPEQYVPATGFPGHHWETCMTMNDTWGYKSADDNWKSTKALLQTLVDIVSKGGNFLLNVGPTAEGLIPESSIERLEEIGVWMKTNGEAVYGTTASPFPYLSWGRCTQNGDTLYLHVFNWPRDRKLNVPLLNKVDKAYLMADTQTLLKVDRSSGKNIIHLKDKAPDPAVSVIVLELKEKPEILPLPSKDKQVRASSDKDDHRIKNLFDGDPITEWQPADNDQERWVEIDLEQPVAIGTCSVVAPRHHTGQKIEIQYKEGNDWMTAVEFATKGSGHIEQMKPVSARYFRLKILESKEPALSEWVLHRAE